MLRVLGLSNPRSRILPSGTPTAEAHHLTEKPRADHLTERGRAESLIERARA
jgi:hypothetical protein